MNFKSFICKIPTKKYKPIDLTFKRQNVPLINKPSQREPTNKPFEQKQAGAYTLLHEIFVGLHILRPLIFTIFRKLCILNHFISRF